MHLGFAFALVLYSGLVLLSLVLWSRARPLITSTEEFTLMTSLPNPGEGTIVPAPSPIAKNDGREGGGGGGGNHELNPASAGVPPIFSLADQIVAPTTRPQLTPPELAIAVTLKVDPRFQPPLDKLAPTGLASGVTGPPSDGPGQDHGIGTGRRGGVGPGDGVGIGPGHDWNTGGNSPSFTGGRKSDEATFDTPPRALNRPHPNYTEEARKDRVQGVVRTRVLVEPDGLVKEVMVLRGLPAGLNEEAIRAAYQMRFNPATKSGRPVATWVFVEIEFNLR